MATHFFWFAVAAWSKYTTICTTALMRGYLPGCTHLACWASWANCRLRACHGPPSKVLALPKVLVGLRYQLLSFPFLFLGSYHTNFEGVSETLTGPLLLRCDLGFHTWFPLQLALPCSTLFHVNVSNVWQVPAFVGIHPSYRLFSILYSFGQFNGNLEDGDGLRLNSIVPLGDRK